MKIESILNQSKIMNLDNEGNAKKEEIKKGKYENPLAILFPSLYL